MNIRNFEVIVDNLEDNPHCLHGPTLLFQKNNEKDRGYYACSACRDSKSCNFHLLVTEKKKTLLKSSNFWKQQQKETVFLINKAKPYQKFIKILKAFKSQLNNAAKNYLPDAEKLGEIQANYCYTCNCLFDNSEAAEHKKCNVLPNLSYDQLTCPTSIVIPKTDTKTHAQYFFSESTVKDILVILSRLKISKVLCIGVPRIHEHILTNSKKKFKCLLLDFEKNYFNFYSKKQFIWYNMFNNYVFDEEQEETLQKFLQSGKIIVLMDPPFGGRVEPLARTLSILNKTFLDLRKENSTEGKLKLKIFWFFPYFMEQHIKNSLPDFKMFDYKVNYDNHPSFTETGNKKRKFGSPVRIFTNVPLNLLDLSGISGYKFCESCRYWVSNENKHCGECNACTSKNGRTYVHCERCSKCVKPSYKHCDNCSRCCLPNHICGEFHPYQKCYHCHQPGHKKRDCRLISKNRDSLESKVPKKKRKIV